MKIMKRTRLNKYVGMLAIIMAIATATSLAQNGRGGHGKGHGHKTGHGNGYGKACMYRHSNLQTRAAFLPAF